MIQLGLDLYHIAICVGHSVTTRANQIHEYYLIQYQTSSGKRGSNLHTFVKAELKINSS